MVKDKPYTKYIQKDKIHAVSNATDSDSDFQELRDQLLEHYNNNNNNNNK